MDEVLYSAQERRTGRDPQGLISFYCFPGAFLVETLPYISKEKIEK